MRNITDHCFHSARSQVAISLLSATLIALALVFVACDYKTVDAQRTTLGDNNSEISKKEAKAASAAAVPASVDSDVRVIDFQTFTYPWIPRKYREYFGNRKEIALKEGRIIPNKADEAQYFDAAAETTFIDLTGDGSDEAVVNLSILLSNRAMPSCIFVYTDIDFKPTLLWSYESGRDVKGFKAITLEDHNLVVEEFNIEDSPICCPRSYFRTVFQWKNSTFDLIKEDLIPYEEPSRGLEQ